MINIRANSIRQKLLNWLLILLIPSLLLAGLSAYYLANYFANIAYDSSLYRKAYALADEVEVKNGSVVADLSDSALNILEFDIDDYIYYQVQNTKKKVVLGDEVLPQPKIIPPVGQSNFYEATFEDEKLRMIALNYSLDEQGLKDNIIILVGETTSKRNKMTEEIIAFMLIPQIILILLVLFLVNLGIQRGLVSLDKLKALIKSRAPLDTHPIEENDAPQELQPLLHAMNELLMKEKSAIDERRHFLANAAHQLKTPLAGLKIQAEAALRESDLSNIQHALKQISAGSDSLARLANQLLSLARAEPESSQALVFTSVNLVQLVHEVTAEWVPKSLEKNIDLGVNCTTSTLNIHGNATLLQELLNNLLDNAIRYNPPYTSVTVGLEIINHAAVLSVQDDGVGIAAFQQQKVFERFYRVLGNAESGCGLGLAIVREIALQHHAQVELTYTDVTHTKGTLVKVIFKNMLSGNNLH
ncbi:MAG: sensor histidine kinase N-terminal domain-containing protein [Methylophilaceae bacterium]